MTHKKANAFHLTKNASILTLGLFMLFGTSCHKSTTTTYLGDWMSSADFDGPSRADAVSFVIGDHAYVATGYQKDNTWLNDNWSFDRGTNTWTQMANVPGAGRNSAVAFTIGTTAYVGTGYDGVNYLNDFYSYNTINNTWDTIANYTGTPRIGAVAFASATNGFVGTGYDNGDNWKKDFYSYNPSTNTWSEAPSYNGKVRTDAVAFVINNIAYVATGVNSGSYNQDMWAFDLNSNTWTQKGQIINVLDDTKDDLYTSIQRSNSTVFVMDNIAYLATGYNSGVLSSVWAYDPSADQWTQKTDLEAPAREDAVSFTINGSGFLGLGQNSSIRMGDFWEFAPTATEVANN